METISVKFEADFAEELEKVMKKNRYVTKTEFIREAVRDKMNELETKKALRRLELAYGAGKKKGRSITQEDIHRAGDEAVREIAKKLGVKLD